MKKISVALLLVLAGHFLRAQLYIQPSVGYMFSTNPDKRETFITINGLQNSVTSKIKNSEGVVISMAIGYDVKKHIRLELCLGAQPFSSFTISTNIPENYRSFNSFGFNTNIGIGDYTYRNYTYQAAALVGYRVSKSKFTVSLLAGPNFLTSTMHIKSHTFASSESWKADSAIFSDETDRYSGNKVSAGFRSSVTVDYKISKAFSLYLNFSSTYNKFQLTTKEVEQYKVDNVDKINTLPSTTITLPNADDTKIDFSQVGMMIGIKYSLATRHE